MKDYSIIIPFKDSVETLSRLFSTIPDSDNIEIILVENSDHPLRREQIGIQRDYILLSAEEYRYAGGARNVGVAAASGKWLIFADADDFFTSNAFDVFSNYIDSSYDLIYFGCNSVYDDTLEQSERHIPFNKILDSLNKHEISELKARLFYVVPWAKMIRRDLVINNNIRFDEVIAANDVFFSTQCAFFCNNFGFSTKEVYVVTTRKGSLSNKWNKEILTSRYLVGLRRNKFLRDRSLANYQVSVMIYIYKGLKMSFWTFLRFLIEALKYRQNIFIGYKNWLQTYKAKRNSTKVNSRYIIKS